MSIQRRMEMERNLPQIPQTLLNHLRTNCCNAGLTNIPGNDILFLGRVMIDYLANTGEGKKVMLKILNSELIPGSYLNQYYPEGHLGDIEQKLDYRGIIEYRGFIYRGQAIPPSAIEVEKCPDLETCEGCGGRYPKIHCVKTIKRYVAGKEVLENLCNRCRGACDDTKIRDTAERLICIECQFKACAFHPSRLTGPRQTTQQTTQQSTQQKQLPAPTDPHARYSCF